MFCKYCGKSIHERAVVCPHCEKKTERGETYIPAPRLKTPQTSANKKLDVGSCICYSLNALYLLVILCLMATARIQTVSGRIFPAAAPYLAFIVSGCALISSVVNLCFRKKGEGADAFLFGTLLPLCLSAVCVALSFVFVI